MNMNPVNVLLISGKRKVGKDFITNKVVKIVGEENYAVIRMSEPVKAHFAKEHNLNLKELMHGNNYKEKYRFEMIKWVDAVRLREPDFFCKLVIKNIPKKPLWIVSDIRRKPDVNWYKKNYGDRVKMVRISADENVRRQRGYEFTKGIDDVISECDLDDYADWDLHVTNNNENDSNESVQKILKLIDYCSQARR